MAARVLSEICKHGVLKSMQCSQCTNEEVKAKTDAETARRAQTAQLSITICLKGGQGVVTIPVPDPANFNLIAYCKMVRADDGVWTDKVHVPWDNILLISLGNVEIKQLSASNQTMN